MVEEEIKERFKLLTMGCWSLKEIMFYFSVSKTKAFSIKERAIKECKGSVPYGSQYATVQSVLKLMGSSRENELNFMRLADEKLQKRILEN